MLKFLPILLIIIAVGGFLFVKLRPQSLTTPAPTLLNESLPITKDTSQDDRIKILQDAVVNLIKQVNSITTSNQSTTDLEKRVTTLENTVTGLQNRINNLNQTSTSQTTTNTQSSTTKGPAYIPLGSGSTSNSDWTSIASAAITFNASDYSGYSSIQFQTSLNIFQTGTAYARLYNKDDGTSFGEVSTNSTTDTVLTSGNFTLPSGNKTYVLQVKSQVTGYAATATNAKIKVNF